MIFKGAQRSFPTIGTTTIKKAFRPEPERRNLDEGEDSEGDFAFCLGDACIERGFQKIDDLLDSRGEAGGEDVSVRVVQPHRTIEIVGGNLETVQFGAGLHQLGPLIDDKLEVFDLEDLLHHGHLFLWFGSGNDRLLGFDLQNRLCLLGFAFCGSEDGLHDRHLFGGRFAVSRLQCGIRQLCHVIRCCPADFFRHLARQGEKIYALTTNGMKILEQTFRSLPCNGMNEPDGLRFLQEAAFSDTTFS